MPPRVDTTPRSAPPQFEPTEEFARHLDETDPLRSFRDRFAFPRRPDGEPAIYFCGNSLGLMPKTARTLVDQELDDWANLAVDAHFKGARPWYSYHEIFRASGARLVGARPAADPSSTSGGGGGGGEVVMMNSLTMNLHLMMVSFFRPTAKRFKIVIEEPSFPSDLYAVTTQLRLHDLNPADALLRLRPRRGSQIITNEDVDALLDKQGDQIALILLSGVNFFTGQVFDMPHITAAGHRHGCVVGFDLAHAAGNIPLQLHDWNVDFACWCSYKYLNSGPGAVAGCFVHERHGGNPQLRRFGGWWGNDPATRFQMHLQDKYAPVPGAEGWQVSNPPILSMAPLKASLDIFDEAGMDALRAKSLKLTGYLRFLLDSNSGDFGSSGGSSAGGYDIITPREPAQHGCQLSIVVRENAQACFKALEAAGAICDFRPPNVIRAAPAPLYNSFLDVWRFAQILGQAV